MSGLALSGFYPALLFVHIVSALGLFAVEGVTLFALRELRSAQHPEAVRLGLGRVEATGVLGQLMPVLALLSGLGLCALAWGFATPWVLLSLGGFVAVAVLIRTVDHPRLVQLQRRLAGNAPLDELRVVLHEPLLRRAGRTRLALLLWLVFLMTLKPGLLLGLGALLVLLAGALLRPVPAVSGSVPAVS